jgi:hypothetical protein
MTNLILPRRKFLLGLIAAPRRRQGRGPHADLQLEANLHRLLVAL